MQSFAQLIYSLGTSTKTNDKLDALSTYFTHGNEKDKVWVIALFSGRRPRRTVSGTQLAVWCTEMVNLPMWLFQECYHTVGDLSETIALLIPEIGTNSSPTGGGREGADTVTSVLSVLSVQYVRSDRSDRSVRSDQTNPNQPGRGWHG